MRIPGCNHEGQPFFPLNWFIFKIGALATKSNTPNSSFRKNVLVPLGVLTTRPVVLTLSSIFLKWPRNSDIGGLDLPTQNKHVTMFHFSVRASGGKFTRDMKMGQVVNMDDLRGDTPSVLKTIPISPFFVRR